MSSGFERLLKVLISKGVQVPPEDVADALWLSTRLFSEIEVERQQIIDSDSEPDPQSGSSNISSSNQAQPHEKRKKREDIDESRIPERVNVEATLHGLGDGIKGKRIRGHPVRLPAAPTLPQMLEMERALRPLARRKPSRHKWELDEISTADFIATSDVWNIIQRPAAERWLEGVLVIEQSPTMRLWQETVREFRQLIWRVGAFRWLETVHLDAFNSKPRLTSPINAGQHRQPLSICRPDASRVIFLCTDSLSNAWLSGQIPEWVALWGKHHSVVILQMLPENMWRRTSLRRANFVTGSADTPISTPRVHNSESSFINEIHPIPVISLKPEALRDLSNFLTASPRNQISCYWSSPTNFYETTTVDIQSSNQKFGPDVEMAIKSFERFTETVSPVTLDLARYLSIVPLFLPIMRLIQYTFVPKSQSAHLAELFNSGILYRVSTPLHGEHPNQIEYDFLPGIRETLLNQRSRPLISDVWKVLSDYIDNRFGRGQEFLSIIFDPSSTEEFVSGIRDEAQLPFARVGATVLRRLGSEYAQAATKLEEVAVIDNKKQTHIQENLDKEHKDPYQEAEQRIESALQSGAKDIDFSNLGLVEIPKDIEKLTQLEVLNLSGNQLTLIPETIKNLVNLKSLKISNNHINTLPAWLGKFVTLQELRVDNNHLPSLPPELGQMVNLTSLDFSNNQLNSLPAEIGQLTKLTLLGIGSNRLTSIPTEVGQLVSLTSLKVDANKLTALPESLKSIKNLRQLKLNGNPLPIPPEIMEAEMEPRAILDYYFSRLKKPLNECKVLVVGQGSVGKTSLIQRLIKDMYVSSETKTEGISITRWQIKNDQFEIESNQNKINLAIWDFGGQEIMHATHQFFLTKRSLYLLVLDSRLTQEENRVEYWLKIIQSFGGESPVLIVGNKIDQHPLDIDRLGLQKKYPNIVGILETSAAAGSGIEEFKVAITKQVNNLAHVRDLLPETWFNVKKQLEELGRETNFITHDKYLELCDKNEVSDEASQRTLIGFLHDLGIILHFQDDPRLEALGILNPQWVTNGVYKILNSHNLFQNKGVLTTSMIDDILNLPEYPRGKRLFIVDMMKKFELCYDIEPDKTFLVPDLLPKDQPDLKFNGVPAFEYAYPVLPSSVITRFIVRMNQKIDDGLVWRTGVVLKIGKNKALVKADIEDRKITIAIDGVEHTRRDALSAIRYQLDEIHNSIKGLGAQKRVPIPGAINAKPQSYDYLLQQEREGVETISVEDGNRLINVNIQQLLNGIESEYRRKDIKGNVNNFILSNGSIGRNNNFDDTFFANEIRKSYNKVDTANIQPELKDMLKQLADAVDLMSKTLPQEQALEVAEDLNRLVDEATRLKPNKKWYSVSIEGLIKAAESLDKLGAPVINLSRRVLSLLMGGRIK